MEDPSVHQNWSSLVQPLDLKIHYRFGYYTEVINDIFKLNVKSFPTDEQKFQIWKSYFKVAKEKIVGQFIIIDNKQKYTPIFRKKDYTFNFMIKTDGFGCSIIYEKVKKKSQESISMVQDGTTGKSKGKKKMDNRTYNQYIKSDIESAQKLPKSIKDLPNKFSPLNDDDLPEDNLHLIGCNPGKQDIVFFADGERTFRYTKVQREKESKKKHYQRLRNYLETEYKIKPINVELSKVSHKSPNYEQMKEFITVKNKCSYQTKDHYNNDIQAKISNKLTGIVNYRKLRWNSQINYQRSMDNMVNNFKQVFPQNNKLICWGDYNQCNMCHQAPTIGVGLRKHFYSKGLKVLLVNENNTSKRCSSCHGLVEKFKDTVSKKPKTLGNKIQVHGLLRCTTCNCVNKSGTITFRYWNRDLNAALNIRDIGPLSGLERRRETQMFPTKSYTQYNR